MAARPPSGFRPPHTGVLLPAQDSRPWSPPEQPRVASAGKQLQVGPATRTENSHSRGFWGFCPGGPPPPPTTPPHRLGLGDCPPLFPPISLFSHGNPSKSLHSCNSSFSSRRLFPDQSPRSTGRCSLPWCSCIGRDLPNLSSCSLVFLLSTSTPGEGVEVLPSDTLTSHLAF